MRGLRRLLGILVCLPFFIFPIKKRLPFSEAKLTVLDVGQGLAVVVKTREHLLLYDTGARFPTGFNMGEAVILPYLQYHGFSKIDKMVISHTDIDHRGGADSLLKSIPINDTINNDPGSSKNCHKVSSWVWDGVTFSFLALPYLPGKDNDNSCVLKITNQVNSIILLGDIEKKSEDELMKRYGGKLKSTVMLVPHHGSKSSSGYDFIKAIAPNYAIVSTGRFNRYHFPHDRVLKRYQAAQIPLFNTAYCGQVDWLMTTTKKEFFSVPRCYSGISP
jgi:competence protein ComEC